MLFESETQVERALAREPSRRGVHGPAQGPMVGSRGNAPAGQRPQKLWGFSYFNALGELSWTLITSWNAYNDKKTQVIGKKYNNEVGPARRDHHNPSGT